MLASPSFAHDQAEAQKAVDSFAANYAQLYNAKDATGIVATVCHSMASKRVQGQS